ncbi:MAG: TrbC/VirB2 family protein [Treponema sp.]|jgi:type IV secretory pathway VirB2 component (pilin)|nr:TrbC/VirB2 family protein [Treponema sp.]
MTTKKFFATALFVLLYSMPLFAQNIMPQGMETLAQSIVNIFTGNFVRTILIIFLCGAAVTYAFNKDNEKMKRNCIAIGVAIAIIMGASTIVDAVFTAAG